MHQNKIEKFFTEYPLYYPYEITIDNHQFLQQLFLKEVTIDSYCLDCSKESTFKSVFYDEIELYNEDFNNFEDIKRGFSGIIEKVIEHEINEFWNRTGIITLKFICQRDNSHKMYFNFYIDNNQLIKVGQYPSTATIDQVEIHKYRKLLGKEKYKEFNTGVGLASHGVGIGSFVYLRRVFEDLIEESHQKAKNDDTEWDEKAYKQQGMSEKIKLLEKFLPPFLVEHRQLYGILSKGVHELDEELCLSMFPSVKTAIEIILDQKIEQKERESKIQKASKFVQQTYAKLK